MTSPTPAAAPEIRPDRRATVLKLLAALALPLFFVVLFPLCYASALHAPASHKLALLVVGPERVVSPIAARLDATSQFSATQTDVPSAAREQVLQRTVEGAVKITVDTSGTSDATASTATAADSTASSADAGTTSFTVTTYVASGGGRSAASAVEAVGAKLAAQLGTTASVVDVAPLTADDELGTDLFYLLIYSSLAGYLVIVAMVQVWPDASLVVRFVAAAVTAVIAPLLVFGLSSIFVGDYGQSFGTIAGVIGIDMLYVFTVSTLAILVGQFLGKLLTFGVMATIVFLNFPSSGGAVPASMLPGFWQWMHGWYLGAGALESFRSMIYFGGNDLGRWITQLLAWTIVAVLAVVLVDLAKTTRRLGVELASLRPDPGPGRHAQLGTAGPQVTDLGRLEVAREAEPLAAQRSITTGFGGGQTVTEAGR